MPQGDDFILANAPPPALPIVGAEAVAALVDPDQQAAPAPASDHAASATAEDVPPAQEVRPVETPEQTQKRSDRAFAALRRANEAQAARIAALEARQEQPAPTELPQPTGAAPVAEDFADHADFVRATARWAVEQHSIALQASVSAQQTVAAWAVQETQAQAKYDDYTEVISADTTQYSPVLLQAIQSSEYGAEVAYHLATHSEDAARISALRPDAALRALGRLEAKFDVVSPKASSTTASAPAQKPRPLEPVAGTGTGGSTVSPDQMSYEDYVAWWKKTHGGR